MHRVIMPDVNTRRNRFVGVSIWIVHAALADPRKLQAVYPGSRHLTCADAFLYWNDAVGRCTARELPAWARSNAAFRPRREGIRLRRRVSLANTPPSTAFSFTAHLRPSGGVFFAPAPDIRRHQQQRTQEEGMAAKSEIMPREQQRLGRTQSSSFYEDPFSMLDRFTSDMDRIFENFGFGRSSFLPRRMGSSSRDERSANIGTWMPEIEVSQGNNELVVRADLPGMKKEDVNVNVTDNAITIQGERRQENESERGGVYRSERSYGSFYRQIPLPEGAITDQAKATFKDGVLEIRVPAPPDQVTRGRRLEITENAESKK